MSNHRLKAELIWGFSCTLCCVSDDSMVCSRPRGANAYSRSSQREHARHRQRERARDTIRRRGDEQECCPCIIKNNELRQLASDREGRRRGAERAFSWTRNKHSMSNLTARARRVAPGGMTNGGEEKAERDSDRGRGSDRRRVATATRPGTGNQMDHRWSQTEPEI
jgi:hypothetical protein